MHRTQIVNFFVFIIHSHSPNGQLYNREEEKISGNEWLFGCGCGWSWGSDFVWYWCLFIYYNKIASCIHISKKKKRQKKSKWLRTGVLYRTHTLCVARKIIIYIRLNRLKWKKKRQETTNTEHEKKTHTQIIRLAKALIERQTSHYFQCFLFFFSLLWLKGKLCVFIQYFKILNDSVSKCI